MSLEQKTIAIFVEKLFEDLEFWYPNIRMKEENAAVVVIAPKQTTYIGKHGLSAEPDKTIDQVSAQDFDALIIPGGYSPDHMRRTPEMVEFVRQMHSQHKPIAAICHAPWMLASAGIIDGKQVTSFFSVKDDLVHAGANWIDKEVVVDDNIITSRSPADLPAFCRSIISILNS